MMHQQAKRLRFAMYVRVSTDEQRDYGQSLAAQRSLIQAAVEQLGGVIVAEYGGSEHATPGHERDEFERMLADAEAGKFDAICMTDSTRWARDTVTSKLSVRRLKRKRVRLFFGTAEQDLRSATVQFALTIKTESTELETGERHDRSAFVRIKEAALGFVTSGHPPYGRFVSASLKGTRRIWEKNRDGTAKWQVDPQAKRYIERAAKLYLAGAGMPWPGVAEAFGDDENTVRRRVAAAGAQWQQKFSMRDYRPEDFASIPFYDRLSFEGDHVTVTIPIPPLLDEVTLNRVRAKAAAHYAERAAPNRQVLGGHLRCANCGGSIGTHYHEQTGAVYLQHNGPRLPGCPGTFGRYEPVARSFFRRVGVLLLDPVESEAAVREAVLEETTRQPELEHELREERAEYCGLKKKHDVLYAKMIEVEPEEGGATMSRLKADLSQLDAQLRAKAERVKELEEALKVTRLPKDFSERVAFTLFCLRGYGTHKTWLSTWPKVQKREMVQFLFGHQSRNPPKGSKDIGAQTGIYLERKIDERSGKVVTIWTAKGWFPQLSNEVWLDPKVTACIRPVGKGGGIDRKRLVQLIRRLDIGQFGFARLAFNASKLEGIRARS